MSGAIAWCLALWITGKLGEKFCPEKLERLKEIRIQNHKTQGIFAGLMIELNMGLSL